MIKKLTATAIFLLLISSVCVHASVPAAHKITVKRIQDYLNGIQTFRGKITQINPNQQQLSGTVYINRITKGEYGKLRIEYDQKDQDIVIADGENLILQNPHSKENTVYSIDQTPASFLLQKKLDLEDGLTVKSLTEKNGSVELVMTKFGAGDASVTLKFSTIPMLKFNGWTIIDMQGNRTDVYLNDVVIGINLDASLFTLTKAGK